MSDEYPVTNCELEFRKDYLKSNSELELTRLQR